MTTSNARNTVTNISELRARIIQLNHIKESEETEIKRNAMEIYHSIHPINVIKEVIHGLSSNEEAATDIKNAGLNMGLDFLIGKIVGRTSSLKGFLSSMLLEKISHLTINKYSKAIFDKLNLFQAN